MRAELRNSHLLTSRQQEVMRWVCEGKSNWETGRIIGCTEATVKKHLQEIFRRLHVRNRVAAILCFRP